VKERFPIEASESVHDLQAYVPQDLISVKQGACDLGEMLLDHRHAYHQYGGDQINLYACSQLKLTPKYPNRRHDQHE
jgi:hypothetical protein